MRLLRNIRAKLNRTFVTDCPRCHKHFYGFHAYGQNIEVSGKIYRILCHICTQEVVK